MARRYPKSDSGRFRVTLTRPHPCHGIVYRPGAVTVSERFLKELLDEDGLVADVLPSV